MTVRKKLIEVALPLEAINKASAYEKMPGIGPHPRGIHLWWARRPLAAARAVIFSQMVDDPSSWPDLFPTEKAQAKERARLFAIIEDLVKWENTTNEGVLQKARDEIWQSWRRACAENADHPNAKELFDRHKLPAFHDPFAGGGGIPLEAQRLGLESWASDLNPVAVLINKAMIELPPKFAGLPPINPEARQKLALLKKEWKGVEGLAEDLRYYGKWVRDEAQRKIGHLYPKVEVTAEMVEKRPDLKPYLGQKLSVIAWLWARTVKSPNPAFRDVEVPLAASFLLSNKPGKEAWVDPVLSESGYRFEVRVGKPENLERTKNGTKLSRGANFRCLMSDSPISGDYIKEEGVAGRMGARLMAIVAEGHRGRIYLAPDALQEDAANSAAPEWKPEIEFLQQALGFRVGNYGMSVWSDLFTKRQLVALSTLSELVEKARSEIIQSILSAENISIRTKEDAIDYANVAGLYLGFAVDRCADFSNSCTRWVPGNQKVMNLFGKQAIAMTWDFAEAAVLNDTVGGYFPAIEFISECLGTLPARGVGTALQQDASTSSIANAKVVSTDPPYYDNIGYADLSDFFYVWLRRSQRSAFGDILGTVAVPKAEELVATPARHGGRQSAEKFFLNGMSNAMGRLSDKSHPSFPVTIYYAFKQSETESDAGTASTGWETFLEAVIGAGFSISGTWPLNSEQEFRIRGLDSNALATSVVLVCRKKNGSDPIVTRREFLASLKTELPVALANLQAGNIAPVDLAQAAIGPGMAVYTRFSKVLDAEGKSISVRDALKLINETLDEVLSEQEGDFDSDTRWAISWFDQFAFNDGPYGTAEQLSVAKVTSVSGLVEAGIVSSKAGVVRLIRPADLPSDWDPTKDNRLTVWEMVHHLVRALEAGGEAAAAQIAVKLGSHAETARELAYRLYTLCERRKRATEALSYNALVQSWPEILRQGKDQRPETPTQGSLFGAPTEDE